MIEVDKSKCVGCGACIAIDEEHFAFDDQGLSEVIAQGVNEKVEEAKDACPVEAISISGEKEAVNIVNENEDTAV